MLQNILLDFSDYYRDFNLGWDIILFQVVIPLIIVFLVTFYIGLERQNVGKAAGISAHVLVGIASAGIAIVQVLMYQEQQALSFNNPEGQRVIAQVVSGIGFIGAGVILKDRSNVIRGITTAATLWTVAMIGVMIGSGYLISGLVLSLLVVGFITIRDLRRGINPLKPITKRDHDEDVEH